MFKLGIIEESLEQDKVLEELRAYFVLQRIERVPGDDYPVWHINEYHIKELMMEELAKQLIEAIKKEWYIHAFDDQKMYVMMKGKYFVVSLSKDESWDEMITYGTDVAKVDEQYLMNIPLHI